MKAGIDRISPMRRYGYDPTLPSIYYLHNIK